MIKNITKDLSTCKRVWLGSDKAINTTVLFRRTLNGIEQETVSKALVTLFADSRYHIWFNGVYLGRGPTYFHPHRRPAETYDLTHYLKEGKNVLATLVHSDGVPLHNYVPAECPGLVAAINIEYANGETDCMTSDSTWKATDKTGWISDTPRRSWAIGCVEKYDAALAPDGWKRCDFDDSNWQPAEEHAAFYKEKNGVYLHSGLPQLSFTWQPVIEILSFHMVTEPAFKVQSNIPEGKRISLIGWKPSVKSSDEKVVFTRHLLDGQEDKSMPTDAFGMSIMNEKWLTPEGVSCCGSPDVDGGGFVLRGLSKEKGAVVCLDLGMEYTGAVSFEMQSDSSGSIDIGWAELMEDNRPQIVRKGNSYVDRYIARKGNNTWFPVSFSAGRYILIILRDFEGETRFKKLGMLASEPDLDWTGGFSCNNSRLNAIWKLCERTVRIGTQEAIMDCPTREQATYTGDGNPTADWIGRLTGDYSYWKHIILETFAVQNESGLIKSCIFSSETGVLPDFALRSLIGVRDYLLETNDIDSVHKVLPACRKLMGWFHNYTDADGLFDIDWERRNEGIVQISRGRMPPEESHLIRVSSPARAIDTLEHPYINVFIDHPGMGWHNIDEPGIDRRGINAAINALIVISLGALADIIEICREKGAEEYRKRGGDLAEVCRKRFWNSKEDIFSDGVLNGRVLSQISQQTNTLCLTAGLCTAEEQKRVMKRILDLNDTEIARSGPYFWFYMLPVLAESDMMDIAVKEIERLWGKMIERDATTAWETFAGDELDSLCHPFGCVPVDFLPRYVVGIGSLPAGTSKIELKPQLSVLHEAQATVMTLQGPVKLGWKKAKDSWKIKGYLPDGVIGRLHLPNKTIVSVRGEWRHQYEVVSS